MKKIAILGNSEFALGFTLTGINKQYDIDEENPDKIIVEIKENKDIGLVIMHPDTLAKFSEDVREKVSSSIEPVFLTISTKDSNEEMKRLIKKSIGIDLWDK